MVARTLLARLRAHPRPAWANLHAALTRLDEADAAALEPALSRWSDEERTFPPELWEAGGKVPPAATLFRHLDLRGAPNISPYEKDGVAKRLARLMGDPKLHHVTRLSLGDEAGDRTPQMLECFHALRALLVRTREPCMTAIDDAQRVTIAEAPRSPD